MSAEYERRDYWALIWPDGRMFVDTDGACPADCWKIGLGWPDGDEIEQAKAKGVRCAMVKVMVPLATSNPSAGTHG